MVIVYFFLSHFILRLKFRYFSCLTKMFASAEGKFILFLSMSLKKFLLIFSFMLLLEKLYQIIKEFVKRLPIRLFCNFLLKLLLILQTLRPRDTMKNPFVYAKWHLTIHLYRHHDSRKKQVCRFFFFSLFAKMWLMIVVENGFVMYWTM